MLPRLAMFSFLIGRPIASPIARTALPARIASCIRSARSAADSSSISITPSRSGTSTIHG